MLGGSQHGGYAVRVWGFQGVTLASCWGGPRIDPGTMPGWYQHDPRVMPAGSQVGPGVDLSIVPGGSQHDPWVIPAESWGGVSGLTSASRLGGVGTILGSCWQGPGCVLGLTLAWRSGSVSMTPGSRWQCLQGVPGLTPALRRGGSWHDPGSDSGIVPMGSRACLRPCNEAVPGLT